MKGISPLIASILLIAFTVAIAGIISVWLTGFTRTTTGGIEAATTNQTKCVGAYIRFDSVTSTAIFYSNPGSQDFTNVKLVASNGTTIVSGLTLNRGDSNVTSWYRGDNTEVLAYGLCLASVSVQGSCKVGDSCWI